jgi:hypothetical protein
MTPLQAITKAAYEAEWGPGSWDLVSEDRQMERCRYMSAGLLTLNDADISEQMIDAGWEDDHGTPDFDRDFRALLRAIATENMDV